MAASVLNSKRAVEVSVFICERFCQIKYRSGQFSTKLLSPSRSLSSACPAKPFRRSRVLCPLSSVLCHLISDVCPALPALKQIDDILNYQIQSGNIEQR